MNQKGFMFTLEVMIAIIILAVAMSVVLINDHYDENEASFTYYSNQSNRITSVYFNDPTNPSVPTDELVICGNTWKYNSINIIKETVCEGYS
jgi:hypothetical protein